MKKIILTGKHGRPSTKMAWSNVETSIDNPITLVQRRQFTNRRTKKFVQYYRVFGDPSKYNESQLYQLKFKNFSFDDSIIIRWGTREPIVANNTLIYNKNSALELATNKYLSRKVFIEKNVSTPKLIENLNDYEGGTIIARPYIHSKGRNFVVLHNFQELSNHWRKGWYYSEFIDKVKEYRIHCGHGKVLAVMEKHKPNSNSYAWNRAVTHSEPFDPIWQKDADKLELREVIIEALKAVKALGLDMGAADVIVDNKGIPYVLEVNTAPTLNSSPRVAKLWSQYWSWLLNRNYRREHWDFTQFTKASSLYWKQNQLNN